MIRVCVAGITGWTGARSPRRSSRRTTSSSWRACRARTRLATPRSPRRSTPSRPTSSSTTRTPPSVKDNVLEALERGVAVVVGSSGMSAADYDEIDAQARAKGVGVIAAGNFSITAALLLRFAAEAARHVDGLGGDRLRERDEAGCAERHVARARRAARQRREPAAPVPVADVLGAPEARGASVEGTQVHSLRLPSFSVSTEALFAADGERLSIRQTPARARRPTSRHAARDPLRRRTGRPHARARPIARLGEPLPQNAVSRSRRTAVSAAGASG